jgi:hypothetical protein
MYGSPSYGAASQSSYGSPPYQNPYESYDVAPPAPPPPLPQRPANRIGIIVGVVLLVVLLIGGGVFAWLAYSSARNAAAATAQATTATATADFTAKGTFTIVSRAIAYVGQNGNNKIYSYTEPSISSGDVTGSYTAKLTLILHPDNTGTFSGEVSCICTVAGKSGPLMWSFTGTSTANDSFQGQDSDFHGTGDLVKLHGQGVFQGQGLQRTSRVTTCFPPGVPAHLVRESLSIYLHLSGLVTRSTSMARIRPTIKGAEIIWPVWLQTTHGVAPGNRRMAAAAPANSAPRFTPSRSPRAFCRLRPDGFLQSSATRRGVRQM